MAECQRIGIGRGLEPEAFALAVRLAHHPDQRNLRKQVIRIAAADIGMNARKPDLADPLLGKEPFAVRLRRKRQLVALVPQDRMERRPLVVDRHRMTGAYARASIKTQFGQLPRPDATG